MKNLLLIFAVTLFSFKKMPAQVTNLNYEPQPYVQLKNADWVKNATIYELNVRQFSQKGDFLSIIPQLPRLKKMGIDIIWLMPINPIGEKNRKGNLGSYYSVKNYLEVNSEFGDEKDVKLLISEIHKMGMHIIIDWVANHSSWDNPLVSQHPDWYKKDEIGQFVSTPWRDYDDIIEFDYSKPELRKWMTDAMKFWVKNYDIDGFRCDVASFIPIDFWENLREELWKIKPVFMLAESQDRDLHRKAFDATYAWELWNVTKKIANENCGISALTEGYITENIKVYPKEAIRMNFTDNHDKNSWEGNPVKNFGASLHAMMVLNATMSGMPLVYNGQEAGLDRSLKFFERDPIDWKPNENSEIFTKLFDLKHNNQALWNGRFGGEMKRIVNNHLDKVISFKREMNGDKVLVFINLSKENQEVDFEIGKDSGIYSNLFSGKEVDLSKKFHLKMKSWEYIVLHHSSKF